MCEYSGKLIAWLDQELPAESAANVAQHVLACAECRSEAGLYRQVSETVDAYCAAALAAKSERPARPRFWRPVYLAPTLAAAAVLLVFLVGLVLRVRTLVSPTPERAPAIALEAPPVPALLVEKTPVAAKAREKAAKRANTRRRERRPVLPAVSPGQNANWLPDEAPVYIAIPADALFPPGAFPEGVGFVADVNLRPDGSARRLRLQPQLVGFQTKGTRP